MLANCFKTLLNHQCNLLALDLPKMLKKGMSWLTNVYLDIYLPLVDDKSVPLQGVI